MEKRGNVGEKKGRDTQASMPCAVSDCLVLTRLWTRAAPACRTEHVKVQKGLDWTHSPDAFCLSDSPSPRVDGGAATAPAPPLSILNLLSFPFAHAITQSLYSI